MDRLIHFASEAGVEVWMRVNQISAFYYLEKEDITDVFVGPDSVMNIFKFPGNHVDEIIAAIHGWDD